MARELKTIGIIGAGAMGRGIAQVCATAGCEVRLHDAADGAVARAVDAIRADLDIAVAKGRTPREDADATWRRLHPAEDLSALADCELVVEAIVERLEPKQALFRQLEGIVLPDCILATNTSSLSVTAIAAACEQPERIAGWHFFNPVPRMRVVEVIGAPRTAGHVVDALVDLSKRIGHKPITTIDSPGFVVNHAGRAFVTEGLKMLSERCATHEVLDGILRTCAGFRMGPFELLDLTGLDVSVPVMESIHSQYYGDDRYRPTTLARTRLLAGLTGRKSGEGFYRHGVKASSKTTVRPQEDHTAAPGTAADALSIWWPTDGEASLPASIAALLTTAKRAETANEADLLLVAPIGRDLSSTVLALGLDASKTVAVDGIFGGPGGITLMTSPATRGSTVRAAESLFASREIPSFVIADSPAFVAPRVVACIVNLACEMAQQGIASPADIDVAVRLGLGYPSGPFEWGDKLGPSRIVEILRGLQTTFGDQRYRPSPWLVRRAGLGLSVAAPDRDE